MKYKTIYLDPPWPEYGGGKICRGAQRHYPLMEISEIMDLKDMIFNFADPDGCHMYMWVTNNHLPIGLKILEHWEFTYITLISWFKEGNIGLGQYFRGNTEHCIFARKGKLPYKVENGIRAQGKTGFIAKKSIHSKKPDEMYKLIEKVSYPPRIELFARGIARSGWDIWGNEIESSMPIENFNLEIF